MFHQKPAAPILTYEEVSLYLSRASRKRPVVLVGPNNAGCLELRAKLMETDKDKFIGVVPREFQLLDNFYCKINEQRHGLNTHRELFY
jgi:hypothetical protein